MIAAEPTNRAEPGGRLLLIRHRQSTWNAEHRWSGQADPPLSAHGQREAKALGPALARFGFQAVVTSDLSRARQTAELVVVAMPGVPLLVDERLREVDIPRWSGRTKAEIEATDAEAYARWRSPEHVTPPGAESLDELERRVLVALHDALDRDETVLVVAHAGVLKVVRAAIGAAQKVKRTRGLWVHRLGGRLVAGELERLPGVERDRVA